MQTPNGQNVCLDDTILKTVSQPSLRLQQASSSEKSEPKISVYLSTSEAEFIDDLKSQGIGDLVASLKMIHDHALYHTDLCLGSDEKKALYHLKLLWEGLEKVR